LLLLLDPTSARSDSALEVATVAQQQQEQHLKKSRKQQQQQQQQQQEQKRQQQGSGAGAGAGGVKVDVTDSNLSVLQADIDELKGMGFNSKQVMVVVFMESLSLFESKGERDK
jgi:hypothetical protein